MHNHSRTARFLALLLAFNLLFTPLLQARFNPKPGFNLFSPDQEIQVGQEEAANRIPLPFLLRLLETLEAVHGSQRRILSVPFLV